MKKVALCIHDLRVSDREKIVETIKSVREFFKSGPITIHLVMDKDVSGDDETFRFLKKEVDNKQLEIVFHGVSHQCPVGTGKLFSWYHKYQAEFISNTFQAEVNKFRYNKLNEILQIKTGICPPCWIAIPTGWKFIKSLSPLYFEKLLSINYKSKRYFSLPISMGSENKNELYFLKILVSFISTIAILFNHPRLRFVVHTIDLSNKESIKFFRQKYFTLILKGFSPVLQKELA
ncbi:MAG: hypothetical protein MUO72_11265 [Bacteroidales bacterium]|nr:hypothetical protein [Bacteroidales bacterium]